ncbi:MAG: hypothetical protein KGL48_13855 [Sphingomonadales bacterium]|nr:hypothetical protein [Sphingomonadales bacterium]MDE2569267.1 hypothetical protein [Sphingomonadales bacterium]
MAGTADANTWTATQRFGNAAVSSGTRQAIVVAQNPTGTPGGSINLNAIDIGGGQPVGLNRADDLDAGSGFVNGLTIEHYYGGRNAHGGRETFAAYGFLTAATGASNANRNYVGSVSSFVAQSGDGGTHGSPFGAGFGLNAYAYLCGSAITAQCPNGAATDFNNITGGEINVAAAAGSSVSYKSGLQIAALPADAVKGSNYDAALSISNEAGATGWMNGILFSNANGQAPLSTAGTLIKTQDAGTIGNLIDASSYTITDDVLNAGNVTLTGAGQLQLRTSKIQDVAVGGDANGVIAIGQTGTTAGSHTPHVDFHTGSSAADVRLMATGVNRLEVYAGGTATFAVTPGYTIFQGAIQLKGYTVATLPACNSGATGALAYVTDATAATYNSSPTGGGSQVLPVFCNGTAWTEH